MRKGKKTESDHEVTTLENAHHWSIDNLFLTSGYRKNFKSTKRILRSLCMKHNELMNVWTHLIGAILFLLLLGYLWFHLD